MRRVRTRIEMRFRTYVRRPAISAVEAELARRIDDDVLLRAVAERFGEGVVIVTADEHMPQE
jgi:hypothetical protein